MRNLIKWVDEDGPRHNYLIEHSAGSGKTKSMAWLAHQLVNLVNPDQTYKAVEDLNGALTQAATQV